MVLSVADLLVTVRIWLVSVNYNLWMSLLFLVALRSYSAQGISQHTDAARNKFLRNCEKRSAANTFLIGTEHGMAHA
jgi:hypothetical protein